MTTATEQMVEITQQAQLDAHRPLIAFQLLLTKRLSASAPTADEFRLEVINVGVGPALDFYVGVVQSPLNFQFSGPVLPMALAVSESIEVTFMLRDRRPFRESGAISWPRDDHDVEAELIRTPMEKGGLRRAALARSDESRAHDEEDKAFYARFREYQNQVKEQVALLEKVGTIQASYRDVHGRAMVSKCELQFVEWQGKVPSAAYWKQIQLGPVSLSIN